MRIYLIGFMGCGKSSLGRRLAKRLDYQFIDIDKEIENKAGMKVDDIFQTSGEAAFREMEKETLHQTVDYDNAIIATGGGAPCHFDNMDFILANGISVYLRTDIASLAHRLEESHNVRPLLKGLVGEDLVMEIKKKLAEREPYYLRANCIIKGENVKPAHIIRLVFGEDFEN